FWVPAIGGLLVLVGGLIVFVGGVGGAAIAITGGVISAGLSVYLGERLLPDGFRVWENEASVGVTILVLAAIAAVVGRD
ncbi:MAG: hypothetical protein ACRED3_20415, partial [Bradyrhizobium sp.]